MKWIFHFFFSSRVPRFLIQTLVYLLFDALARIQWKHHHRTANPAAPAAECERTKVISFQFRCRCIFSLYAMQLTEAQTDFGGNTIDACNVHRMRMKQFGSKSSCQVNNDVCVSFLYRFGGQSITRLDHIYIWWGDIECVCLCFSLDLSNHHWNECRTAVWSTAVISNLQPISLQNRFPPPKNL